MFRKYGGSAVALGGTLVLVSALASATVALTSSAADVQEISYKPIQAISHVLGSKRAVGYYARDGETCAVTLMVAEAIDPELATPLSAARVRVSLHPGQTVQVDSDERKFLDITCGPAAETVEARVGDVSSGTE